jgi:C1A family cysteine protease
MSGDSERNIGSALERFYRVIPQGLIVNVQRYDINEMFILNMRLKPLISPLKPYIILHSSPLKTMMYKPTYLTSVKNQGKCGSCWALVTADVIANRVMIATGGAFRHSLSAQQLLECYPLNKGGCYGVSDPEDVFRWIRAKNFRLVVDTTFPYKQTVNTKVTPVQKHCSLPGVGISPDIYSITTYIDEDRYDPVVLRKNIENMKKELFHYGPFYATISVYDDISKIRGPTVYNPSPESQFIGGHAVLVVGYHSDKFWIVKNTWGLNWMPDPVIPGYFFIKMGSNACGIESRCGSVTPDLPYRPPDPKLYMSF